MRLSPILIGAALIVVGSCTWFVITTITMDQIPDAALMAASLLCALVFVSAFAGTPSRGKVAGAARRDLVAAAAAGIMTWYVPAMVVLTQRATDAPSGTEMLFFTTASWTLLAALVALAFAEERPVATQVAAVALSLVGAATVLANWERPSSFSPFVKFPLQEGIILVAGVLFAVGLVMGRRSGRLLGSRTALWIGVAAAALVATLVAVPGGFGSVFILQRIWPQLLLAGAALATLATGLTSLVRISGLVRATAWLLLAPVAVTALSVVERLTVVYGPNPLIIGGVLGGVMIVLIGLAVVQLYPAPDTDTDNKAPARPGGTSLRLTGAARVIAFVAVIAAAVGLFLPAFSATAAGMLDSGGEFRVAWSLAGAESAVGWTILIASLLALALAVDVAHRGPTRRLLAAAVAASATFVLLPLVIDTPLRTWNRWIPAEIQQAYGTEYARLSVEAAPSAIRLAGAVLGFAACVILIVVAARERRSSEPVLSVAPEENV